MKVESALEALEMLAKQAAAAPSQWPPDTIAVSRHLVDAIRSSGAVEMQQLRISNKVNDIGSLLIKFSEISQVTKQEWITLAETNGFSLTLNPRDSARDVMNKIARYLRDHPESRERLATPPSTQTLNHKTVKGKRKLAESLQATLTRLIDE